VKTTRLTDFPEELVVTMVNGNKTEGKRIQRRNPSREAGLPGGWINFKPAFSGKPVYDP
jgi:hypothetical protein